MSPVVVSAVILLDDSVTPVVLPIPVDEFKSTVPLVTKPDPLIEPLAVVIVTKSKAVVVPANVISPLVEPVVTVMSLPESVVSRLPATPRTKLPLPSSPAETVINSDATTAELTVISSSAFSVTVVGSIAASIVISPAESRRIVPLPFNFALTVMPPEIAPARMLVSPTTVTLALSVTPPVLTSSKPAPAVLEPETNIELASETLTEPAALKVKLPKRATFPALSPSVTALPAKLALPATKTLPLSPSETSPTAVIVNWSTSTSNSRTSPWAARTRSCASTLI